MTVVRPAHPVPSVPPRGDSKVAATEAQVMKSILDRSFRYTPSHATDVRKTFERARQSLESKDSSNKVLQIRQPKKGAQTA
jgi:hypothetical protein